MTTQPKPLKWYRELAEKKARLSAGVFLVEGEKAIGQIMDTHPDAITEIISAEDPPPDLRRYPVHNVSTSQFKYISHTQTPQGIAAVVRIPADAYSARLPTNAGNKILLLEDIQDPGNTGTLIRTAAAFNFSGVILADKCADPFSPKVVQATAGAVMSLWVRATEQYLELVKTLQKNGYPLLAAELDGRDGLSAMRQNKLILALGNEAGGLSPEMLKLADYHVLIPIDRDKAESLNAAVCGGILMYLSTQGVAVSVNEHIRKKKE
jgi:RNA methyltransferase, TrmH family